MRTLFWGSDNVYSIRALKYLHTKGFKIIGCVCDNPNTEGALMKTCRDLNITAESAITVKEKISSGAINNIDLGFSYSYHKLIKPQEISICNKGILNFHPSPLPEHKGIAGCCYAIYQKRKQWGVSVHYVDEGFDTGDLLEVQYFDVPDNLTGIEMYQLTQKHMLELFYKTVMRILNGENLIALPQKGGEYYSRQRLNSDKSVQITDTVDQINSKIEAFWFPPYHGATIEIDGETFTLVNKKILEKLSDYYDDKET